MGDRRQARELALQALFFIEMDQLCPDSSEDGKVHHRAGPVPDPEYQKKIDAFTVNNQDQLTPGVLPFFEDLIKGVLENQSLIDNLLEEFSKNWKISRMPVVDKNIMRIAAYEMIKRDDIPTSVTINEAVEIGKKYGTRDSGPFINGVLDRIKSQRQ